MSAALLSTPEDVRQFASFASAFGNIDDLLASFERGGITVGVDRRLRLMWLLARIGSSGPPPDREMLRALLIPVIARSGDEQIEIGKLVDQWFAQNAATSDSSALVPDPEKRARDAAATVFGLDRWWLGLAIGIVAVAIAAAGVSVLFGHFSADGGPVKVPTPVTLSPQTNPDAASRQLLENILSRLLFAGAVLACGFALFALRTQTRARLTRRIGETDLVETFKLYAPMPAWFRSGVARRFFDQLKRSRWFEINQIDARKSVAATVRAGGIPKIVRMLVRERPQYVLFVDRGGDWDHSDLLAKTLEAAIAAADIVCTRYDYVDRPTRLSQVRNGIREAGLLPLSVIGSRHAGERLIIVGRGSAFFEQAGRRRDRSGRISVVRPGTPAPELLHLREFSVSFMLTPTPRKTWGQTERHLADLGLLLATADVAGIAEIAAWLMREPDSSAGPGAVAADALVVDTFAERLSRDGIALSSDIPPAIEEIERLVVKLRAWVNDKELFTLIVAIGIFQKVDPAFTQVLARLLLTSREGILDLADFSKLLQLPWLRDGRFPEWLRIALANALDPEDLQAVRKVQIFILEHLDSRQGDQSAPSLDALAASFNVARALTDDRVRELASRIDGGGLLDAEERVFVSVLKGAELHPVDDVLQPEAPAAMREKMEEPERRRQRWLVSSILVFALLAAIVQPWVTAAFFSLMTALQLSLFAPLQSIPKYFPDWFGPSLRGIAVSSTLLAAVAWLRASLQAAVKPARLSAWLAWAGFVSAVVTLPFGGIAGENPELSAAWMPVLSGLAVLLWVSRVSFASWWRTPDFDELWQQRLRRDDWLASTLGAALIGLTFAIPYCLVVIPESTGANASPASLSVASAIGGLGWCAAQALLRRFLIGDASALLPGRPWLDMAYGTVVFLLMATFPRYLSAFETTAQPNNDIIVVTSIALGLPLMPFAWLASARAVLGLRSGTGRFALALRSFALAIAFYVPLLFAIILSIEKYGRVMSPFLSNVIPNIGPSLGIDLSVEKIMAVIAIGSINLFAMHTLLWLMLTWQDQSGDSPKRAWFATLLAIVRNLFLRFDLRILARAVLIESLVMLVVVPVFVIAVAARPRSLLDLPLLSVFAADSAPGGSGISLAAFWALLVPPIVAFWPMWRFICLPEFEREQAGKTSLELWLGAALIAAFSLTWKGNQEIFSLAPLALPVAIFLAWRWGERAIVPIVAGALPLALSIQGSHAVATPGGIWPLLAILFWCRFVRDPDLWGQLLRREHLNWTEVALIVLPLCCAAELTVGQIVSLNVVLAIDPDWMIATVAVVVGASRMPKQRLLAGFVAAGLMNLALGTFGSTEFGIAGRFGFTPGEVFLALVGLYVVPACRSPRLSRTGVRSPAQGLTLEEFEVLRRRYRPSDPSSSITVHYASAWRLLFDPDKLIFGFLYGLGLATWQAQSGFDIFAFVGRLDSSAKHMLFEAAKAAISTGPALGAAILFAWGVAVASPKRSLLSPAVFSGMILSFAVLLITFAAFPKLVSSLIAGYGHGTFAAVALGVPDKSIAIFGTLGICVAGFYWFGLLLPVAIKQGPRDFSFNSVLAPLTTIVEAVLPKRAESIEAAAGANSASASARDGAQLYREQSRRRRMSK